MKASCANWKRAVLSTGSTSSDGPLIQSAERTTQSATKSLKLMSVQ